MLDDISALKKIDKSGALDVLDSLPEACEKALENARELKLEYPKPRRVIITGMGGSAIGGDLMRDWLKKEVSAPIETYRGFQLPVYAGKNTLVIAASYSGNTRETLSAFKDALKRGCMCVAISSGGKLLELAETQKVPCVKLPQGIMPRFAISYLFLSMAMVFQKSGLIEKKKEIDATIGLLKKLKDELNVNIPTKKNVAKKLASEIDGKIPIIYTFGPFKAAAKRLKCEFNENSKIPAFWGFFPEISHNEIEGWASELSDKFYVIFFRDKKGETTGTRGEIEATESIVKRKTQVGEICAEGSTKLEKILSLVYIGDYVSVYLALAQGKDPTPVDTIQELKGKLIDW